MSERRMSQKQIAALIILAALGGYVMGRLSTNLRFNFGGDAAGGGGGDSTEYVVENPGPPAADSDVVPVTGAPFLGPAAAKVTIVEFSDFQCPYCSRAIPVMHELMERNGDDLRVVFRHLPLPMHPDAAPAARAAVAAHEMGQFWAYHDLLFANQRALDEQSLVDYAEEVGLDPEAFAARLASDEVASAVDADAALARRLGLNGTPSFMVNGREVVGALPPEEFQRIIDREIQAVDALLEQGVPLAEVYRRRVAENTRAGAGEDRPAAPEDEGSQRPVERARAAAPPAELTARRADAETAVEPPAEGTGAAPAANGQPHQATGEGHAELTVYLDYSDPASLELARAVEQLRADYGEGLSVHFMPLADPEDPAARTVAAALGRAAAEGRFAELHGLLLSSPAPPNSEELIRWAQSHNLDDTAFALALEESAARAYLAEARQEAARAGIVVDPTVRIGDVRLSGPVPLEDLRVAVNAALEPR